MNSAVQARQGQARQQMSHPTPAPAGGVDERGLADMLERVLRHPADKLALVLHLSRLPAPAPHVHHLRVANALMQDCAQRFEGQVLGLPGQDMLLVATMPPNPTPAERAASPVQLRETLARLFASDLPEREKLTSFWHIQEDPAAFATFIGEATAASSGQAKGLQLPPEIPQSARSLLALEEAVAQAPFGDLLLRQTGMFLDPDRRQPIVKRLKPAFRAVQLSIHQLNLRPEAASALADPYLHQSFSARLDAQLVGLLHEDLQAKGSLCRGAHGGGMRIHVTLGVDSLLTKAFARLSRLALDLGVRFAIQVSLLQATLGIEALERARKLLDLAGFDLVIGPLDAAQLGLASPDRLQAGGVRIIWSQHLADQVADRSAAASRNFARIPPERIILKDADTEQAVGWGQAQGISRYQGRFLEMAAAATRMDVCFAAAGCTMRQCAERAGSTTQAGRLGCMNTALLDAIEVAAR